MSNYVKSTNFATKDSLSSGDPLKIVKGTEINTEYDNIATAVATKADLASPTFTGTVVIPTATITTAAITTATISGGTITGITDLAVADGGTGASTAAGARTALSAAALGANSDITALSGLTTALSVAQGGTGAATATAYAVQCGGTTSTAAHQSIASVGTSGQILTSNGAAALPTFSEKIVLGTAVATTSGTSVDFTSIPSWVKRITVMFDDVSTNGSSNVMVQLGTSGGVEIASYSGSVDFVEDNSAGTTFSNGFLIDRSLASGDVREGAMTISSFGSNKWVETSTVSNSLTALLLGAGRKTLSGTLDRVRITTANGTDTFDAGTINILYE